MGRTIEKKYRDDLIQYQSLCDIVLCIRSLEEQKNLRKNVTTKKLLLTKLLDSLEELSPTNADLILTSGKYDYYASLINTTDHDIYQKYTKELDKEKVVSDENKINHYFFHTEDYNLGTVGHDTNINLIDYICEFDDIAINYLFSNAPDHIRNQVFVRLLETTNFAQSFDAITNRMKTFGMKVDVLDHVLYEDLIRSLNQTLNHHFIIAKRIANTSFVLDLIKSGVNISYCELLVLLDNYFNPELMNVLMSEFKKSENEREYKSLENDYLYPYDFHKEFNNVVLGNIYRDFNETMRVNFEIKNGYIWDSRLAKAVVEKASREVKNLINNGYDEATIDKYMDSVYNNIVSRANNQKQTEYYVEIGSKIYTEIDNYHQLLNKYEPKMVLKNNQNKK